MRKVVTLSEWREIETEVEYHQKKIVRDLINEGFPVEEGWSFQICLEILMRMDIKLFNQAVDQAASKYHDYHDDYLAALETAIVARALNLT